MRLFSAEAVFDGTDVPSLLGQAGGFQFLLRRLNGAGEINGPIGDGDLDVGILVVRLAVEELEHARGDDFVVQVIIGFWFAWPAKAAENQKREDTMESQKSEPLHREESKNKIMIKSKTVHRAKFISKESFDARESGAPGRGGEV